MTKTISILGCGWLGEPFANSLIKKGYSVKGSTTSKHKIELLTSQGIQPYLLDLEHLSQNILTFLNSEILVVTIPSKNIEGFKQLIAKIEASTIQKVLFISSTSVYKNSPIIITEEADLADCSLKKIEQLFLLNKHFETTIIRFSGLFGYQRNPTDFFKINKIIPNPEGVVNMIHRDDCIEIIERIITKNCWNEIFNACTDSHPKRRDFYTKSYIDLGYSKPLFKENDKKSIKIIGNEKLKKKLNYKFNYPDLLNLPQ
jgi:nucleoside-diphosphate-sugar epimerase